MGQTGHTASAGGVLPNNHSPGRVQDRFTPHSIQQWSDEWTPNLGRMITTLLLLCTLCTLPAVHGYAYYEPRIPNGDMVLHPCKPNHHWKGVGHTNYLGGGPRNAFGQDFDRHGHKWTKELCQQDSDGDGMTNGQELGDPDCVWKLGKFPDLTVNITNPGVCDPFDSPLCKEHTRFVDCSYEELDCPYLQESHVQNITLQFPRFHIPPHVTTYVCYTFDLPADRDYHIIGFKPIVDNAYAVHHIAMMDCTDLGYDFTKPADCHQGTGTCGSVYGLWSVGMSGVCLHKDMGYRFGKTGLKRLTLEFHLTNPEKATDWWDETAMVLYYTDLLRPNDGGILLLGQEYMEIPPGNPRYTADGVCTGTCTRKLMTDSIYVVGAQNHMHYTGLEQSMEVYRDGELVNTLIDERHYSYDDPKPSKFETPVEIRPGDDMHIRCVYNTVSRPTTTYYGDGSTEEMCYGILTFFPASAWQGKRMCTAYKDSDEFKCAMLNRETVISGCPWTRFVNFTDPHTVAMVEEVLQHCNAWGGCRAECPAVVNKVRQHPCLQGYLGEFLSDTLSRQPGGLRFLSALRSCDCDVNEVKATQLLEQRGQAQGGREESSPACRPCVWVTLTYVLALAAVIVTSP